jgi:hypothetical protein
MYVHAERCGARRLESLEGVMVIRSLVISAVLAAAGSVALAEVTPYTVESGGGGYQPRTTIGSVWAHESASMCLLMVDAMDRSTSVNMGGHVVVPRGSSFADLGANRNGGGSIQGSWDEVISGTNRFINVIFRTTDGSQFMPPTASVNGSPAFFWKWQFGTTDVVGYQPWVQSVGLTSARIYFSANGGQSFSGFSNIAGLNGTFMSGRDNGNYLANIGDGTNYILMQYQINPVPAPAGAAALGGAALLLGRRRRR